MADRKSLFSRFWPPSASSASRRTSTTTTAAAAQPTTTSTPSTKRTTESQPRSQSSPTSGPPPRDETKTPSRQSTTKASSSPPTPTTPPRTQPRKGDQPSSASPEPSKSPSGEVQKANQQTTSPSKDEPKTSSPSRATTRSPSSSKPASPSRLSAQSRSPPQPSSPSHARPTLASQTPSTPKRATKPNSPSRVTSRSPKQGKLPASPSKGSPQPTETISTTYGDPILASQQEPEMKEEVKPDSAEVVKNVEAKPSTSSEVGQGPETREENKSLDSSPVNGGHEPRMELDSKPEETKDVKEVVQATKKEVDNYVALKMVEKAEIPGVADQIQREKQEALDTKDRSKSPGAHDKSALPNVEHKNIKADDMSKFSNQFATSDRPVNVITLAGENRGASMQLESDSSKREGPIHIHRSYKINPDDATTDGQESSGSEGKKSENERPMDDQLTEAYVNNNAQGINNSIVFNSSITEGNPGVHMVVSHLPKEPIHSKDKTSCPETRKAEINMSRAQKLTYHPTVRRRCLRGLLMETSDSDPENPQRHGCRACQKGDIDVL